MTDQGSVVQHDWFLRDLERGPMSVLKPGSGPISDFEDGSGTRRWLLEGHHLRRRARILELEVARRSEDFSGGWVLCHCDPAKSQYVVDGLEDHVRRCTRRHAHCKRYKYRHLLLLEYSEFCGLCTRHKGALIVVAVSLFFVLFCPSKLRLVERVRASKMSGYGNGIDNDASPKVSEWF